MDKLVNEITDSNFEQITAQDNVLVDFWAPWCGPCKMLGPVMDELAEDMQGKVKIYKMNIDENPETASKLGIRGIPTVLMYKEGKVCFNYSGAHPKEHWIKNINQHL